MISFSPINTEERRALDIRSGDTVRVWQKIAEADGKTRLQAFEGLVIARKHGREPGGTFTVRKIASGVGVEKIFPLYSPVIDTIELVRRAKVRRAKLYYIRDKSAKEIRRKMKDLAQFAKTQNDAEQTPVPEQSSVLGAAQTNAEEKSVENSS